MPMSIGLNVRGSTSPNTSSYFSYSPGLTDPGANQVAVITEAIHQFIPWFLMTNTHFDTLVNGNIHTKYKIINTIH